MSERRVEERGRSFSAFPYTADRRRCTRSVHLAYAMSPGALTQQRHACERGIPAVWVSTAGERKALRMVDAVVNIAVCAAVMAVSFLLLLLPPPSPLCVLLVECDHRLQCVQQLCLSARLHGDECDVHLLRFGQLESGQLPLVAVHGVPLARACDEQLQRL